MTITQYEDECIPRQIKKIRTSGSKKAWVEGDREKEEGIWDEDPVKILDGIGQSTEKLLARMGIKTVRQFARLRSSRIQRLTKQRGVTVAKVHRWIEQADSAHDGAYQLKVVDHRKVANPYKSRYGDAWQEHIRKDIRRAGWVCITDLILHMCKHTAAAYEGTEFEDSWFFYHDALTQLTCKLTRAWMQEMDLMKRWLLPVGPCNAGTVYFGRPVGNTPEIMPWDTSLNHDVHARVEFYSAICRWIPKDHPLYAKRFSKASYNIMRDSYLRVLDPVTGVVPSSDRIVQDINACWGNHLDMICAKGGGAVPNLGNRMGKRKLNGLKKRGGKRVKKEWKALENLHPDIVPVWKAYIERSRSRHSSQV